jgi:transposase
MRIITVGIDLAKNIFAVHGVNEAGKHELIKPKVTRDQLLPLVANLPAYLICIEAYAGERV